MKLDFSGTKILVIGDIMLDWYWYGYTERYSPEAPVPVIDNKPKREEFFLGGAGNLAMNIASLGGHATLMGVIGEDKYGKKIKSILDKNDSINNKILTSSKCSTIVKKRIFLTKTHGDGQGGPFARIDYDDDTFNRSKVIQEVTHYQKDMIYELEKDIDSYDAVVLSDYNKGVTNPVTSKMIIKCCNERNIPVFVDPKHPVWDSFENATAITPNLSEIRNALDVFCHRFASASGDSIAVGLSNIDNENLSYEEIFNQQCKYFQDSLNTKLVITKSEEGISLIDKKGCEWNQEAYSIKEPDVSGAGDTIIAALSLAYVKTNDIELSAKIANAAAAVVVGKPGTATATIEEIEKLLLIG